MRTKDPEEAKVRNAAAVQKQALIWARYGKQPGPLPQQQILALSGVLYREIMAGLGLEPGEASVWQEVLNLLDRVAPAPAGFRPLTAHFGKPLNCNSSGLNSITALTQKRTASLPFLPP